MPFNIGVLRKEIVFFYKCYHLMIVVQVCDSLLIQNSTRELCEGDYLKHWPKTSLNVSEYLN